MKAGAMCPANGTPPPVTGEFAPQGVDTRGFSKRVHPGDDFFEYANEGWIGATLIPHGFWDFGQTSLLGLTVDGQLKRVIAASVANPGPRGGASQQIGAAYLSFLDTERIERAGLKTVRADLRSMLSTRTSDDIVRWMAKPTSSSIVAINVFPAAGTWRIHLDQQNLTQPMLGLPGRESYERNDGNHAAQRAAYQNYVAGTFRRAGVDNAAARAVRLVALEGRIAATQWDLEKLRDRRANYHPMSVDELAKFAPGFPWRTFLVARGAGQVTDIVLGTDTAMQAQSRVFADTPIDDWRSYLAFHWLQNQIEVLPAEFREASFAFYGQTMSNATIPPARADVALRLVNSAFGPQLGRLYAEHYFSTQARASAGQLIVYLKRAFAERFAAATWLDDATRAEAQAKLANLSVKVGFPKIWRDYSGLTIRRDDAAGNLQRIRAADWNYQLRRFEPNTADEPWYQTPQTIDASYSVLYNALEVPAAFLQPPYFDAHADAAANFGAIGAIIGHEIGHGFDDQGIVYDSRGRLRNGWSEESLWQFHARAQALVDQYNAFSPIEGVHVNGRRTLGENIADLSGVSLSFRAYQLYRGDHPCEGRASYDGLTGEQRFFLAWAQAWRYKAPESAVRFVAEYGYHAPTPYRVNGVVQNLDAWYDAFGVKPGDKLFVPPERRVRIW